MPKPLAKSAATSVLVAVLASAPTSALETDQQYGWGRPLADSTDVVNAKFNLELERAVSELPPASPPEECSAVAAAYRKRLRSLLLHPIMLWAWNSSLVHKIPADPDEHRIYRRTNLYSNHPVIDPGSWMPYAPTISVGGIRFGVDKLSHFVSSGWTYYATYRKALAGHDTDVDEAVRAAVRRGILEESLLLGGATVGSLAVADVEAAFEGLNFYRDLCEPPDQILARGPEGWVVTRPIDLRDYVNPRWDESFQPPVYSRSRWRKVRPMFEGYCERLEDPQVVEMLARYRSIDRETVVGKVVKELVSEGKLKDPAQFGFEAVCPQPKTEKATDGGPARAPPTGGDQSRLKELIVEEERTQRRRALGLFDAQVTYPQVLAVSLGVMATRQPASYDCRTLCRFRGPFAQIEPGLGGAKLSAGWGSATGSTGKDDLFLTRVYIATGFKATLFHTWGEGGRLDPGQTYGGAEFDFSIARVNLSLGLLHRLDHARRDPWVVTWGIGWGF